MALPATGSLLSINTIQVYYGYPSQTTRSLSFLGANHGPLIPAGQTVSISSGFGGY